LLDPAKKKVAPEDRRRVVIETARRLIVPGVDVLKAEFPLDISVESDEREWRGAVTPACGQVEQIIDDATLTIGSSSAICACGAAGFARGVHRQSGRR